MGPCPWGLSRLPPLCGAPQLVCIKQSRAAPSQPLARSTARTNCFCLPGAGSRALGVPSGDVLLALSRGVPDKRTAFSLILALAPTGFPRGLDPRALCPSPLPSSLPSYREMSVTPWQGARTERVEVGVFSREGRSGR